ncbi:hypothetical protein H4Q26_009584 [Puccinia striiformis f. sp. tritici PST-130]|nr:hypothetical protein H4Q26_009584 [Puccinia striiformis f. sp. tritici PST-130]
MILAVYGHRGFVSSNSKITCSSPTIKLQPQPTSTHSDQGHIQFALGYFTSPHTLKPVHIHTVIMVPTRIWLSLNNDKVSVETDELEFVADLVDAAKNQEYARSLGAFYISDITLHITEDAKALTSQSRLAELAEELSLAVRGDPSHNQSEWSP